MHSFIHLYILSTSKLRTDELRVHPHAAHPFSSDQISFPHLRGNQSHATSAKLNSSGRVKIIISGKSGKSNLRIGFYIPYKFSGSFNQGYQKSSLSWVNWKPWTTDTTTAQSDFVLTSICDTNNLTIVYHCLSVMYRCNILYPIIMFMANGLTSDDVLYNLCYKYTKNRSCSMCQNHINSIQNKKKSFENISQMHTTYT